MFFKSYYSLASVGREGKDARVCNMIGCPCSLQAGGYKTPHSPSVRQSAVGAAAEELDAQRDSRVSAVTHRRPRRLIVQKA